MAPLQGSPPETKDRDFLSGGGEMGERIRAFIWGKTPPGPAETWSPALRMMTRFLLANRFPLLLWWGPQYVSIYNDPYRPVLGTKHPWALGQPVSECWKEIWHILQPLIDTPFNGGPDIEESRQAMTGQAEHQRAITGRSTPHHQKRPPRGTRPVLLRGFSAASFVRTGRRERVPRSDRSPAQELSN